MRMTTGLPAAAILAACMLSAAGAQTPPSPTPPPETPAAGAAATQAPAPVATPASAAGAAAAPAPPPEGAAPLPAVAPSAVLRIVDAPEITVAKLPADNPYAVAVGAPAALPAKLPFADAVVSTGFFVSIHVDQTGKALMVRRDRDPIPSLAGETLKSISRWTLSPARRGGQPVETWGAFRLDLSVQIRSPKILQMSLTPVTAAMPIPAPMVWLSDTEWLDSRHPANPTDGTVPIVEVDTAPIPSKTPWSADSFKGPFTVKFWVKVDKSGKIARAIPLEVGDPVLLGYFRKAMNAWIVKPAQAGGAPVDSWNELTLSGQISYSDDIKQIAALRRPIGP